MIPWIESTRRTRATRPAHCESPAYVPACLSSWPSSSQSPSETLSRAPCRVLGRCARSHRWFPDDVNERVMRLAANHTTHMCASAAGCVRRSGQLPPCRFITARQPPRTYELPCPSRSESDKARPGPNRSRFSLAIVEPRRTSGAAPDSCERAAPGILLGGRCARVGGFNARPHRRRRRRWLWWWLWWLWWRPWPWPKWSDDRESRKQNKWRGLA